MKIPVYKKGEDTTYGNIKYEDILELFKEQNPYDHDKEFDVIKGFKEKLSDTKVRLTIDNVNKVEKKIVYKMLNKWGLDISYINPVFSTKERFIAYQTHPFYCFISVCVVFEMDSIYGENMENLIPPAYFNLPNFKDILIEYMVRNKIFNITSLIHFVSFIN